MINIYLTNNLKRIATFSEMTSDPFEVGMEVTVRSTVEGERIFIFSKKEVLIRIHPVSGNAVIDIWYTLKKKK